MRNAIILSFMLIAVVMIAACTKQMPNQEQTPLEPSMEQNQPIEPEADTTEYVDSQFVDSNETVEIGEMV